MNFVRILALLSVYKYNPNSSPPPTQTLFLSLLSGLKMEMSSYYSIGLSVLAVLVTYWAYRFLNWIWFNPKRLEKCLRDQGFRGNPYTVFFGDQKESGQVISQALAKPINIDDDIKPRVIPYIMKTIKQYGSKSFMWVGEHPRVNITQPELVREVLTKYNTFHKNHHLLDPITKLLATGVVTIEGEKWAKHRRIINSTFHFEKLKLMLPAMHLACVDMVDKWDKLASASADGAADVEVHRDLETLSGDVISRTLFGTSYHEGTKIFALIKELTVLTIQVMNSVYIPGWRYMPTKRNNRMKSIAKEIKASIREIISKKTKAIKSGESDSNNFLGILLECNSNEIKQAEDKSATLTIDEIIDECQLFYFAGQETTSTLLVWTLVALSRYPEWQTRAREEVLEVFKEKTPDYDGINNLKIVTMILYEVLRLNPPVVELTKVAMEDTKLGDLSIPAGTQLMLPIIVLHHDPEVWGDDAKEFKPERFAQGVIKATKIQGSYFPFSLGPRMCIGQNFALLEAKMALAIILQRFSFEFSPSYVHAPFPLVTVQPDPQFGARLTLRKL